ncbi:putative protein phosphatase 2C 8 [Tasmannia lanceolata]|uniref:putative protein phosphatase 2C 8 n=1 Tax=Tasmannia lanceolata TaxID=3420 RepID=UPI00406427E9
MKLFSVKRASINSRKRRAKKIRLSLKTNREMEEDDELSSSSESAATLSSLSTSSSSSDLEGISEGNIPVGILVATGEVIGEKDRNISCRSHGSVSVCGRRRDMEDAVTVVPGFIGAGDSLDGYDFFGVYDGHAGCLVANACRDRLHHVLKREIEDRWNVVGGGISGGEVDWEEVLKGCFWKMDEEVGGEAGAVDLIKTIGSTAVVGLVGTRNVVVANCGDSRAVLSRAGVAVPLSRDHKPDRPDEMERVEAAGGRVINWDGYRVLGVLATSRSIGDHYMKPYVISTPEVIICERTAKDEFLILASDGLWDVVSNEMACEVARRCFSGQGPKKFAKTVSGGGAAKAAAVLAELAMVRGSRDNISVIVVELSKSSGNL